MPQFVVLLRGVNVGQANRIAMADFRDLLEERGFSNPRTLLNSGNAVFENSGRSAAAHARSIAIALRQVHDIQVQVVVKSSSEFSTAVEENTLEVKEKDHSKFLAAFAQERAVLHELSSILPLVKPPERFVLASQAAYLHCPGGILESKAAESLLGKAGRFVTTRNWATVLKIEKLLSEGEE